MKYMLVRPEKQQEKIGSYTDMILLRKMGPEVRFIFRQAVSVVVCFSRTLLSFYAFTKIYCDLRLF